MFVVILVEPLIPFLEGGKAARTVAAMLAMLGVLAVVYPIALYALLPFRLRFAWIIAQFIMAASVTFAGGAWIAIPFANLKVVQDNFSLTVETGDAVLATVIVLPSAFAALLLLYREAVAKPIPR